MRCMLFCWILILHISPGLATYDSTTTLPDFNPCLNSTVIPSDENRIPSYTLQEGDLDECESSNMSAGWYRYRYLQNIPTEPTNPGQCGSSSPIWLNGTYPVFSTASDGQIEYHKMKACLVSSTSNCKESWEVTVVNCFLYNVIYLEPVPSCGRYCMDLKPPYLNNPCNGHNVIETDYTRLVSYTRQYFEEDKCDTINITAGWYRYDNLQNVPTYAPLPGQCGSSSPIWFRGTYPTVSGENVTMTACRVGNYSDCEEWWSVQVMHCYSYNIVYLEPRETCGRYCMESDLNFTDTMPPDSIVDSSSPMPTQYWTDPCYDNTVIYTDYTRYINYILSPFETEQCDTVNLTEGWYRYEGYDTVPTYPPQTGQCGSSFPIWFRGSYPTIYRENRTMNACMVGDISDCGDNWNVTVMRCDGYNIAYLKPFNKCGRYCLASNYSSTPVPDSVVNSSSSIPTQYWTDPCSDNIFIYRDYTRYTNYTLSPSDIEMCDTVNLTEGWYSYEGFDNVLTYPPKTGQCGSSSPIWFEGSYPTNYRENKTLTACMVGDTSDCKDNFNVTVMRCDGYNIAYLKPFNKCGRYCLVSSGNHTYTTLPYSGTVPTTFAPTQSLIDPCYDHTEIQSDNTRFTSYTLSSGEIEQCDTVNLTEGWYRYEGYGNVPTYPPQPGQCGSSSPIWFQGSYPTKTGENKTMKACMVENDSNCTDHWNVTVMRCDGYNIAYLKAFNKCGRYCLDGRLNQSTTITSMPSLESITSANTEINIALSDHIYTLVNPIVPTYNPYSLDRQLMFQCDYTIYSGVVPDDLRYDVIWKIDDVEFVTKWELTQSEIHTEGRLKSTELTSQNQKIGFNVKCGIRVSHSVNAFVESPSFYAGIDLWPKSLSVSSGESAKVYVWTTVPVACSGDSSSECTLWVEMLEFNEQFTSGAPLYCNDSITELTKPSLCGLELSGWSTPYTWQTLDISLPANTAQDQEYEAKLQLRVREASHDTLWSNVYLPEITIYVVNENVTNNYWWWYSWCFTGTDPWFFTFDWQWYGFHDEGEFVLYRHKTKPIEVHTIQRRYETYHTWTEHCAIAIRAASDVFIIYGCGRPTKWIVRREGCDVGNEYLEVYSRWGGYEITLPTGTRVYVWISVNRRLNIDITPSRSDRDQTEGLCGTWNEKYEDDFTGRDGIIYSSSTLFARTWSVPTSDSLFIAKQRTEKLTQSFMYCSCTGSTFDQLSPNVDCSWKESLPVCPPLGFGKESCTVRTKRSTDVDEDITIDVSPDITAYVEHSEATNDWKNGWNESSSSDACNEYFSESILFDTCSALSNVNASSAITNCILNIQVSGTDEYMADSFEMFKTQCTNEVRTNNTLWSETTNDGSSVAKLITENICPFDCKYKGVKHGDCLKGSCNCYTGFAGDDCRVNMTAPPTLATELSDDSFCDSSAHSCSHASVFGENFYESSNLLCRIEKSEIISNVLTSSGTSITTKGILQNLGEVKCPLTAGVRRRKRSTSSSSSTTTYQVSVTNNGQEYSEPVPVVLYDSACTTCSTSSTLVFCQQRSDVCVVDGACYAESSSQCASSSESSSSKLWIIGVVSSLLIVTIIVLLVIKFCKGSKYIPVCGERILPCTHHSLPNENDLYKTMSRESTPEPMIALSFPPIDSHYK